MRTSRRASFGDWLEILRVHGQDEIDSLHGTDKKQAVESRINRPEDSLLYALFNPAFAFKKCKNLIR